jgi:hypothetical protein
MESDLDYSLERCRTIKVRFICIIFVAVKAYRKYGECHAVGQSIDWHNASSCESH